MGRRRSNRRRKGKGMSKTSIYTRRSSRAQASQIYKLSKQLRSVRRNQAESFVWTKYQYDSHSATVAFPGVMFPLINPTAWTPIFNAKQNFSTVFPTGTGYHSKAKVGNLTIKGIYQIESGAQVQIVNLYIVRLKQDTCQTTLTDTGNMNNLMEYDVLETDGRFNGEYYSAKGSATLEGRHDLFLNKKAFSVVGHRSFICGDQSFSTVAAAPEQTAVTNVDDPNKRFQFNIRNNFELEVPSTIIGDTHKAWKTMTTSDIAPTDQLYLLCFNNAVEGSSGFIDWNMTVDVKEANT